ncbi:hypothetical protein QJS10_CPA09g00714 [Acorus calamus]|uniref:Uncharacterized protein n=1 Tax=Acorus calamus TaxID=4465 RepID=A0AAV9E9Q8_ACOCL|nr:hypothetical protein QJS10_CPA09g00714 [Acorus calamus]
MPLMRLTCTALERVPLTRAKIIEQLMKKFHQDLLVFCRSPGDNDLTKGVNGKKVTEYPSIAGIMTSKNAKIGEGSYRDAVLEANACHLTRKTVKRKKKSSLAEIAETNGDSAASHKNEASEDGKKCSSKSKRLNQIIPPMKQGKSIKVPQQSSSRIDLEKATTEIADSTAQVPVKNQEQAQKDLQKALSSKDIKSSQNIVNVHPNKHLHQVLDQGDLQKGRLRDCSSFRFPPPDGYLDELQVGDAEPPNCPGTHPHIQEMKTMILSQ